MDASRSTAPARRTGRAGRRYRPRVEHPPLRRGSRGDMVVWAQQHLVAAGATSRSALSPGRRPTRRPGSELHRLVSLSGLEIDAVRPRPLSATLPAVADEIDPVPRR